MFKLNKLIDSTTFTYYHKQPEAQLVAYKRSLEYLKWATDDPAFNFKKEYLEITSNKIFTTEYNIPRNILITTIQSRRSACD